jgi:hypothetical protein
VSTASEDQDSPGVARGVPEEGDFEEALRRELRCTADRVEPARDGLTSIFRQLDAPWPVRQASLLFADCVDLLQLITVWLQPMSARAMPVLAAVGGSVRGVLRRLSHALAAAAWLRAAVTWLRAAVTWLRPVLAVAVTAIVVMTGTVALSQTVARIELSDNRPAGISALAGPAPPAGDQREIRAGDLGGSGPSQVMPARGASPASGGGTPHQHSCAASGCRSGPAASASSAEPTAHARPSVTPTPKHAKTHHNSHQHHRRNSHQHHRPHTGRVRGPGH